MRSRKLVGEGYLQPERTARPLASLAVWRALGAAFLVSGLFAGIAGASEEVPPGESVAGSTSGAGVPEAGAPGARPAGITGASPASFADYCTSPVPEPGGGTGAPYVTGAWRVWNELGIYGQGVKVGIASTGGSPQHEALTSNYAGSLPGGGFDHNYAWFDSVDRGPEPVDSFQIGTFLSGVAVGVHPDLCFGVAPQAKYAACKNTDGNGRETIESYLTCLNWMRAPLDLGGANPRPDLRPDVIYTPPCLSCGPEPFVLQDPIAALRAAGTVVVTSSGSITAGQNNCNKINSAPSNYPEVITVGGLRKSDNLTLSEGAAGPASLDGIEIQKPDMVVQADAVLSSIYADGQSQYLTATGTEIAAGEVVGVVALMLSANPELKGQPRLVEDILYSTALTRTGSRCDSGGEAVPNNEFGFGELDAYKAVQRAMAYPFGGCPQQPLPETACRMNGRNMVFSVTQNLLRQVDDRQQVRFRFLGEKDLRGQFKGQFGEPHLDGGESFRLCVYDTVNDPAVPTGVVLNSGFELKTAADVAAGSWKRLQLPPNGTSNLGRYIFRGPSVEGNDGLVSAYLDEKSGNVRLSGTRAALPLARLRSVGTGAGGEFPRAMYEAANGVIVQAHSTASGACWGAQFDEADIVRNSQTSFRAGKRGR